MKMNKEELDAPEQFHKIKDQLEEIIKDFENFNSEEINNIHTEKAEKFRRKILSLEAEASKYFEKFCYCKNS